MFFPENSTTRMKIPVKMGQNQSSETGSPHFILFALKRKSQLIQRKQERKRGLGGQKLVICAIVKKTLKSDPLIAPHIKGGKESLLTCSLISQESRN